MTPSRLSSLTPLESETSEPRLWTRKPLTFPVTFHLGHRRFGSPRSSPGREGDPSSGVTSGVRCPGHLWFLPPHSDNSYEKEKEPGYPDRGTVPV